MGVFMMWHARCETCPATDAAFCSQGNLLDTLKAAGWKVRRVMTARGYTRLCVLCPACKDQFVKLAAIRKKG